MNNDKTITPSFCYTLAANLPFFFAFYLILPISPFYSKEEFTIGKSMIGFILPYYTLAAFRAHPFAGCSLNTLTRRPLYLVAHFIFIAVFGGYMVAIAFALFTALRVVHGFTFSTMMVAGNTILIDILPPSRRGGDVGYYGLANNIAMNFRPAVSLFTQENFTYDVVLPCSLLSGSLGSIMAYMVKTPYKQPVKREPISLGRSFLAKGTQAGAPLLLFSIPYGMTTTYVVMCAAKIGISVSSGLYFTFMAVGPVVSRLFSGRQVNKGRVALVTSLGMYLAVVTFFLPTVPKELMHQDSVFSSYLYVGITLSQGAAFGTMFPALNTPFVNLAPDNQRGTAMSTYLTSWGVGIGIRLMTGGSITQELSGLDYAYLSGAYLMVLSTFLLLFKAGPHFNRYRLR